MNNLGGCSKGVPMKSLPQVTVAVELTKGPERLTQDQVLKLRLDPTKTWIKESGRLLGFRDLGRKPA